MNTSATGGYLEPSTTTPVEDDGFEDLIGGAISGIAAIERGLVRPRWQQKPPPQPKIGTNWCSVGITEIVSDYGWAEVHFAAGDGHDELTRHDTVRVLASFYGPNAHSKASQVRDGLCVSQNRDALRLAGVALLECTTIRTTSALVNEQWVRRADLEIVFRRAVIRVYPILNLLSAQGAFRTDLGYVQNFVVTEN